MTCCWSCWCHAETLAALLAALVPSVFVLGVAPEGNGGSGGPLEESMGRSTSPALSCGVSTWGCLNSRNVNGLSGFSSQALHSQCILGQRPSAAPMPWTWDPASRHKQRPHDSGLAAQTPSPEAPSGHLHRLLHQRRPAAAAAARAFSLDSGLQGWRRSCSPETAVMVPGPAGRQSSAPQSLTSLATGNSEGASVRCLGSTTQLKADP